ncbi:guided entry of tail-anchored proteins factor 1-like [Ciona intestinalis]
MLFYTILMLSFARPMVPLVLRVLLPLIEMVVISKRLKMQKKELQMDLKQKLEEQSEIDMMDQFAKYARLQRKIDAVKDEIQKIKDSTSNKMLFIKSIITWTLRLVIGFSFLYIMFFHKHDAVLQYPKEWAGPDILAKIVAFPTGEIGAVGGVFWLIACQSTVGAIFQQMV